MLHAATVGTDPVAVAVSDDGSRAYLADSSAGDVYAVRLPSLAVAWEQHLGGAPFALLVYQERLYVSLYSGHAVDELRLTNGSVYLRHALARRAAGLAVDQSGNVVAVSDEGYLLNLDGTFTRGDSSFGVALVAGQLWTADYPGGRISRPGDGAGGRSLPDALHPFWLAPGANGTLLISAEGAHEDTDPGAVYAYDVARDSFRVIDRPLDPDEAVQWGPVVVVAAHGSRRVDVIDAGHVSEWAQGAAAVAVAPDSSLNVLVVAVNSHE